MNQKLLGLKVYLPSSSKQVSQDESEWSNQAEDSYYVLENRVGDHICRNVYANVSEGHEEDHEYVGHHD